MEADPALGGLGLKIGGGVADGQRHIILLSALGVIAVLPAE